MALFDSVHNMYERMVVSEVIKKYSEKVDEGVLEDILCVALNKLPSHYIRHSVDAGFYLTSSERAKIDDDVSVAVEGAYEQVMSHREGPMWDDS